MFSDPSNASGIKWADLEGSLLLIKPLEVLPEHDTQFGPNTAVVADVTVLDGAKAGESYTGTRVYPKALQGQIRGDIGNLVLARVGKGQAKNNQSAPWLLSAASEADKQKGRDYLAKTAPTPF